MTDRVSCLPLYLKTGRRITWSQLGVHWIKQQHAASSLGIYKCPLRWIVCEHVVPEVSPGSPENTSAGWKDTDLTEAIKSRALSYMEGKHSNTAPQEMMQDWRRSLASESEDWSVISGIKGNMSCFQDVTCNLSFCILITWTFSNITYNAQLIQMSLHTRKSISSLCFQEMRPCTSTTDCVLHSAAEEEKPSNMKRQYWSSGGFLKSKTVSPSSSTVQLEDVMQVELNSDLITPTFSGEEDALAWWKVQNINCLILRNLERKGLLLLFIYFFFAI